MKLNVWQTPNKMKCYFDAISFEYTKCIAKYVTSTI